MTVTELKAKLDAGESLYLLDVREQNELTGELGHIEGIHWAPVATVDQKIDTIKSAHPSLVVTICRSGARSGVAQSLLEQGGLKVENLNGGMLEWSGSSFPIQNAMSDVKPL